MSNNSLKQLLRDLKLPTVVENYDNYSIKAGNENWSYNQYLEELLEVERQTRKNNRIQRLLRESRLPLSKNLDNLDQKRFSKMINNQIHLLCEAVFLDRHENVLIFGNPGSGKTHTLCAIAQELIKKGKRVLFKNCEMLVQELLVAKRELKLPVLLKKLRKYDGLIIDDIGYVQQSREEMEVLFSLLADRYERSSTMISSNLQFSEWEKIFKDPMTTAAAIDRLVHHSVIIELNIPSYRLEEAKKKEKK